MQKMTFNAEGEDVIAFLLLFLNKTVALKRFKMQQLPNNY